jgi:hypothetical protein
MPRLGSRKSRVIGVSALIPLAVLLAVKGWFYPNAPSWLLRSVEAATVAIMFIAKAVRESEGLFVSDEEFAQSGGLRLGNIEVAIGLTVIAPVGLSLWAMDWPLEKRRIVFAISAAMIVAAVVAIQMIDRKASSIIAQIMARRAATTEAP